jgi:hypothetical protein
MSIFPPFFATSEFFTRSTEGLIGNFLIDITSWDNVTMILLIIIYEEQLLLVQAENSVLIATNLSWRSDLTQRSITSNDNLTVPQLAKISRLLWSRSQPLDYIQPDEFRLHPTPYFNFNFNLSIQRLGHYVICSLQISWLKFWKRAKGESNRAVSEGEL